MSTERVDVGRRTGVKVTSDVAHTQDGIEDPVRFFETAQSPSTSVESGKENHSSASTVVAVKPQKKIRFSLDEDVADVTPTFDSQHHGPNLVRAPRGSLNSSHLSVPTAVALVTQHGEDDEDSKVEISRNSVDEEETGASADMEEIVAQQKRQQSLSPGDFPMGDVPDDEFTDNNEEDDDLVPPPPPDSPDRDEDDEIAAEADETASTKSRVSFSTDDLTKHNANDDFHTQIDDYEENDDDDKEGPGFQIKEREKECVGGDEDSETESVQKRRHLKERTKLDKKKQDAASARSKNSRKKKKMTVSIHESIDDDSEDQTKTPATKKRKPKKKINPFASSFSPKGIPLPRSYTSIPVSDCKEDSPEDKNLRRSKRARTSPLEFWRGEKPVYGANSFSDDYDGVRNMPVVVGFTKADPTPYKKRKVPATVPKKKAGKNGTKEVVAYVEDEPFDTSRLRSKLKINDGKIAQLWDERYQDTRSIKVVSYHASTRASDLPMSRSRKKSEGKVVGKAAQSFHMSNEENPVFPGYIVGSLVLPPKGIKDAEAVGLCAQVFTVVKGQAKSIEVAYDDPDNENETLDPEAAERFLLSPGDNFLVPPGNTYRLQNHSKTTECLLSWVIIRHNEHMQEE